MSTREIVVTTNPPAIIVLAIEPTAPNIDSPEIKPRTVAIMATVPLSFVILSFLILSTCFDTSARAIAVTKRPPDITVLAIEPIAPNIENPEITPSTTLTAATVLYSFLMSSWLIFGTYSEILERLIAVTSRPPPIMALAIEPTAPNTARPDIAAIMIDTIPIIVPIFPRLSILIRSACSDAAVRP